MLGRVRPPSWTSWFGCGALASGQYEAAFRENEIDETVLPSLTAEDLKELGVASLGHRRKLLDAIAALRADADGKAPPPTPRSRVHARRVPSKTAPSAAK